MTRTEIIAQLNNEIGRLERARDFLTAELTSSNTRWMKRIEKKLPTRQRKLSVVAAPARLDGAPGLARPVVQPLAAAPVSAVKQPEVQHLPPRRRMQRRSLQADKAGKSPAALSGQVPAGPVAVSAVEARKMQERAVPAPPVVIVPEPRPEIGAERSLSSLIQAFERRTGMSGTP